MINLAKDPKGFYVALGVDETATVDDIKAAFRHKAKKLHPDHNPSPIAAKQFHRVHEAYETLTDPLKRAAYDRGWRTVGGGAHAPGRDSAQGTREQSRETHSDSSRKDAPRPNSTRPETPRAEAFKADRARATEPPPTSGPKPSPSEQPVSCKCGTVTAQPRYIVFDMVWGRGNKVLRRGLAGIYCRTCADRAAIRASFVTWVAGWWALPNGPAETVKAIWLNIRGGRIPAERNARLLVRQARAFRARGDMELARGCAEQALSFAANSGLRREIDSLLVSLSSFPARALKNRWARPGAASMIQALPGALLIGAVAMSLALSSPKSLTETAIAYIRQWSAPAETTTPSLATSSSGQVYAVASHSARLRTGPGENYQVIADLPLGTVLLVVETDPAGAWARAVTEDDAVGFVPVGDLTTQVSVDALEAFSARRGQKP